MTETVEQRWRTLLARGEAESREVDADSPLRMIIGVNAAGRPYFAVISTQKPELPDLPTAIQVTRGQRATDAKWTLTLELLVPALTDAFVSLVADLASKSAAVVSEREALQVFLSTLEEWRELLTGDVDRLTEDSLRGLIAELWFGFESETHGHHMPETVRAWSGPLGGAQDFQYPSPGLRYEVKSLRPNRSAIEVSSAEQLDGLGINLVVVTVQEVEDESQGVTLPRLLRSIRGNLPDARDRSEFNRRFANLRVGPDDPWYSDHAYAVVNLQVFDIRPEFPALRRSQLPLAIARTRYRVDIQHIREFIVVDTTYSTAQGVLGG